MKQQCIRYTITVRGKEEGDLKSAFDEAVRAIHEGYQSGHNSNDTGAYYFDSTTDVPKGDRPA